MRSVFVLAALLAAAFAEQSTYEVKFIPGYATVITQGILDNAVDGVCTQLSVSRVGDSTYAAMTGTYTVTIEETLAGTFGTAFGTALQGNANVCAFVSVKLGDASYFTLPSMCSEPIDYEIIVPSLAAANFSKEMFDAAVVPACSASGGAVTFVNSTYSASGVYTVFVNEGIVGTFGKSIAAQIPLRMADYKCFITVKSGEDIYYSPTGDCYVEETYELKIVKGVDLITKDLLDTQIESACESAKDLGIGINFVSSTFDGDNGIYKVTINVTVAGAFGQGFEDAIGTSPYKCAIIEMKDGNETRYTRNDAECFVNTTYIFGLSLGTPTAITKGEIDTLISGFASITKKEDLISFASSTLNATHYIPTVRELNLAVGKVASGVCEMIGTVITFASKMCYVTYIEYNGEQLCFPRTDELCLDKEVGINTPYEVKYYGTKSDTEIDTFFENAIESIKGTTRELIKVVEKSYKGNTYKTTINEPVVEYFGEQFCGYLNSTEVRCDFGPLKADGKEVCKFPDCPNNGAFGFTPVVFLMALIIAFLF